MSYLVDSDLIASYLNGRPDAILLIDGLMAQGLAIALPTYGEILEGILFGNQQQAHQAGLDELLESIDIAPLTVGVMRQFASIRGALRQQGQIIPDMDILIAATAIEHDLTLISRNRRHFERVPGPQLYEFA